MGVTWDDGDAFVKFKLELHSASRCRVAREDRKVSFCVIASLALIERRKTSTQSF